MNLNYKDVKRKYGIGNKLINNPEYKNGAKLSQLELAKRPYRYEIINYLLSEFKKETTYLEIGVRNPDDNFNKIKATNKYSVDPGLEFDDNPVDFPFTSDVFFDKLKSSNVLHEDIKFDVIFIDGLHLADQVWKDIMNAELYLSENGFIILHDCNPPTEWHARENYSYNQTPSRSFWNGTTWKAYYKYRCAGQKGAKCIDTDWGVGILSDRLDKEDMKMDNTFFEFHELNTNRQEHLGLISFEDLKRLL